MNKVIKTITSVLLILSLAFVVPVNTTYAAETVADFEIDPELWKCILETNTFRYDSDKDGVVTKKEFASAYGMQIDAEGYDIKDWSGLKYATDWQMISIRNFPGGDFSALSELDKLWDVNLRNVTDAGKITGLENIPNLSRLSVSFENEVNLDAYKNLPNLGSLYLDAPKFSGYEALSEYNELHSLSLSGSSIEGVENLPELPGLIQLSLYFPDLDDETLAGILAKTPNIMDIIIHGSKITNVDWLKDLQSLKFGVFYISIEDNQITDISALLEVIEMLDFTTELYLGGNPISEESRIALIGEFLSVADNDVLYTGASKSIFASNRPITDIVTEQYLVVESADNEIIEINDGRIVAKQPGTTTLKFTYYDIEFEYTLTVKDREETPVSTEEGVYVTLSHNEIDENKSAFVISVDNRKAYALKGEFSFNADDKNFDLDSAKWNINGIEYDVDYEDNMYRGWCIQLPTALANQKAAATLTLEYEPTEDSFDTMGFSSFNCNLNTDVNNPGYFVVNNLTYNELFGRFDWNGGTFKYGQRNKELRFLSDKLDTIKLPVEGTAPWQYYENDVEKVVFETVNEVGSNVLDSCKNIKEIYFYNRNTIIADDIYSNMAGNDITVYGYYGSTAEAYAKANGFKFVAFDRSQSGTEDDIEWIYDENTNEIIFSGEGLITDYYTGGVINAEWWNYRISFRTPWSQVSSGVEALKISDGITRIGKYAFTSFGNVKDIYIADSVVDIVSESEDGGDIFPAESKEQIVIHCSAGTAAEEFAFSKGFKFVVEDAVKGDTNGDEQINARDALEILKMAAKLESFKYYQADYNEDYSINAVDALEVLKYAAGII